MGQEAPPAPPTPPMFRRTVSADDLARLKAAREEADRAYNEALTALDRAIQSAPEIPYLSPPTDDTQIAPLNDLRKILPDGDLDLGTGWRARLLSLVWHLIGPILRRQEDFNSGVVDYINHSVPPQRPPGRGRNSCHRRYPRCRSARTRVSPAPPGRQ